LDIVGHDFGDLPNEHVDWLWKGYLATGNMTVLAAPPKAGKSTLLFELLKCSRARETFLGLETQPAKVLLFTEESVSLLANRRRKLRDPDLDLHVVTLQPGLTWPKIMAYSKWKAQQGYNLVVLDTVSRFWPVQNEGDAVQVLQALTPFLSIVRQEGFALLLIHHTRKGGGAEGNAMRGSNAILGSADIGLEFQRITPWDKGKRRRIDALSRYGETPDTIIAELTDDGYQLAAEGVAIEKDIMFIVTMNGVVTAEEVVDATATSVRNAQRVLAEMTARGVLSRSGTGSSRSPYRYSLRGVDD
jgi:predicted ATP-dependent serine protease